MEYVIAVFVGVWIAASGLLSYWRIRMDFKQNENDVESEDQKA